jgi:predicted ATPase
LAALLRQLQALVRRQPVLMIFEDLHWIDPTSREVLDLAVAKIADLPVLLVATYRPEFQPPWVGQSQVTVIALNRLGRAEGATLVRRLAGNLGALPPDVVDESVERTDGVPLFVEELTKAVVEAAADRGYASISAVPASSLAVPATYSGIPYDRVFRQGKSLIQPRDGALEIRPQRLRSGHSGTRRRASRRKFSGTRLKSTTSIV